MSPDGPTGGGDDVVVHPRRQPIGNHLADRRDRWCRRRSDSGPAGRSARSGTSAARQPDATPTISTGTTCVPTASSACERAPAPATDASRRGAIAPMSTIGLPVREAQPQVAAFAPVRTGTTHHVAERRSTTRRARTVRLRPRLRLSMNSASTQPMAIPTIDRAVRRRLRPTLRAAYRQSTRQAMSIPQRPRRLQARGPRRRPGGRDHRGDHHGEHDADDVNCTRDADRYEATSSCRTPRDGSARRR